MRRLLTLLVLLAPSVARAQAPTVASTSGSVDSSHGSYSETVEIATPGYGEIAPDLSLGYNSSSIGGTAGIGWELDGFSFIERVGANKGAARYDSTDIFLIDGEELIPCTAAMTATSPSCRTGGTHATRLETWLKYGYSAATDTWTVWMKNGARTIFQPIINLGAGRTFRWGISQVIDTQGKTVTYGWWCDNHGLWGKVAVECYPSTVTYDGTEVRCHYEQTTDPVVNASGSHLAHTRYRLKTVDVKVDGSRLRTYALTYQQYCGDYVCSAGETCGSCPSDCGACAACGDGVCLGGETCGSCPSDCGPCAFCGDGMCTGGETCGSCAADCGECTGEHCGNGLCNGEGCSTCPADCGACSGEYCGNGTCAAGEDCSSCYYDCGECPADYCGDGACSGTENAEWCPSACGGDCGGNVCGNGCCDDGEDAGSCGCDCGGVCCGDGVCGSGENAANCGQCAGTEWADCPANPGAGECCGNGVCEAGENGQNCGQCWGGDCPADAAAGECCGNGNVEPGEDGTNCPACPGFGGDVPPAAGACCGDGTCSPGLGENAQNCPSCPGQTPTGDCAGPYYPNGCCEDGETRIDNPIDCGTCGNGTCEADENCGSCQADCGCAVGEGCFVDPITGLGNCAPLSSCGDDVCQAGSENCSLCYLDCACASPAVCLNYQCQTAFCGNGSCDAGAGENCDSCSTDCACTDGRLCINSACTLCGDGACQAGAETCSSCPGDCGCPSGEACWAGSCVADARCGDGTCEPGTETCDPCPPEDPFCTPNCWPNGDQETCETCWADCSCGSGQQCTGGICRPYCGNGGCDTSWGESCATCTSDCGCGSGERCEPRDPNPPVCATWCGNLACDGGENCATCAADCPCGGTCVGGACTNCGDGACEEGVEHCYNCPADCSTLCAPGEECLSDGTCVPSATCNNGICDSGYWQWDPGCECDVWIPGTEDCSSCPADCGCGGGLACQSGICQPICGDGACLSSYGENCHTCAADCGCAGGTACYNPGGGPWQCIAYCGNGTCNAGAPYYEQQCACACAGQPDCLCAECPQDCGACPPSCGGAGGNTCGGPGSTICNGYPLLTSSDCAVCCYRPTAVCGNGSCEAGEYDGNCPQDCGCAAAGACGGTAPGGCGCYEGCDETYCIEWDPFTSECIAWGGGWCCIDACAACGAECPDCCGCPTDNHVHAGTCGSVDACGHVFGSSTDCGCAGQDICACSGPCSDPSCHTHTGSCGSVDSCGHVFGTPADCSVCGNGSCEVGEYDANCPQDCGCAAGGCGGYSPGGCGCYSGCDGTYCIEWDPFTSECIAWGGGDCCVDACSACGAACPLPSCGAAGGNTCAPFGSTICNGYTTYASYDCPICCYIPPPPPPVCGDGSCNGSEDVWSCPSDCGCNAGNCGGQAQAGCWCDGGCVGAGDCCPNACSECGHCPPGCPDGSCNGGEDCSSCPEDCGTCCTPSCPGGSCDWQPDGCGGSIWCGDCPCTPSCPGGSCDWQPDGCGGSIWCGDCVDPNSCQQTGSCGGQAPGGCWCDPNCVSLGDCCYDGPC